jgi:hypothetical protein
VAWFSLADRVPSANLTRVILRLALVCASLLALGACSSGDESWTPSKVSVAAVRQAAAKAGTSPKDCPLKVDVRGALRSAGVDDAVKLDSAEASASKSDKPAADPIGAQLKGMSPVDAYAGALIDCDYKVGDGTFSVYLVVTRTKGAVSLVAPVISRDAEIRLPDLNKVIVPPPGPGEIRLAGHTVAVGGLAADGGDAAMMVSSGVPKVNDDTLRTVASKFLGTVAV